MRQITDPTPVAIAAPLFGLFISENSSSRVSVCEWEATAYRKLVPNAHNVLINEIESRQLGIQSRQITKVGIRNRD